MEKRRFRRLDESGRGETQVPRENRFRREGEERKETPEEMVRSLQGIFCTGRYRTWVLRRRQRP